MSALLALSNVTASYGPSQALFDVSLSIGEGEVVALMGRNGMGKSTTVKTICGILPSGGEIRFKDQVIGGTPRVKVSRLVVGLVREGRRWIADLWGG